MARAFDQKIYDVGQRIREKRQSRGMSQTDLALVMDTTKTVISRWENGERVIRLDSLFSLSEALSVPLVSILDDDVEDSCEEYLLACQIRELPSAQKQFVCQAVQTLIRGLKAEESAAP